MEAVNTRLGEAQKHRTPQREGHGPDAYHGYLTEYCLVLRLDFSVSFGPAFGLKWLFRDWPPLTAGMSKSVPSFVPAALSNRSETVLFCMMALDVSMSEQELAAEGELSRGPQGVLINSPLSIRVSSSANQDQSWSQLNLAKKVSYLLKQATWWGWDL